jgi:hypothetical protein
MLGAVEREEQGIIEESIAGHFEQGIGEDYSLNQVQESTFGGPGIRHLRSGSYYNTHDLYSTQLPYSTD